MRNARFTHAMLKPQQARYARLGTIRLNGGRFGFHKCLSHFEFIHRYGGDVLTECA